MCEDVLRLRRALADDSYFGHEYSEVRLITNSAIIRLYWVQEFHQKCLTSLAVATSMIPDVSLAAEGSRKRRLESTHGLDRGSEVTQEEQLLEMFLEAKQMLVDSLRIYNDVVEARMKERIQQQVQQEIIDALEKAVSPPLVSKEIWPKMFAGPRTS
jgi:hypothetical protein